MGLFDKYRIVTSKSTQEIIDGMLSYYRDDEFFASRSNSSKVEDWLRPQLEEQIPALVEHGYTYEFKGNYVVSCDVDDFVEQFGPVAESYFASVSPFLQSIKRETNDVAFIGNILPKGNHSGADMFKLLEHVRDMWVDKGYTVFMDAPSVIEYEHIYKHRYTKNIVKFAGKAYFRWSPEMRK